MKKLFTLFTFMLVTLAFAKPLGTDVATLSANGATRANVRSVTFIFNGGGFTGTIGNNTSPATFTSTNDSSLTITAPAGDTLDPISYTFVSGTMRVVTLQ